MRIIYLCGALDELTRRARGIETPNLAATQKIFNFCSALRGAGHNVNVLSLGRGRQNGSGEVHAARAQRISGIGVIYARFVHRRWSTHVVTAWSLVVLVRRLSRIKGGRRDTALLAYNRLWHYVPALLFARASGMRCFLDLEDGYANRERTTIRRITDGLNGWLFDRLCSRGVLLANTALEAQTSIVRRTVWYGMLPAMPARADWSRATLGVLLGGTLHEERGCRLFMSALGELMECRPDLHRRLHFYVSGHGPMENELATFAGQHPDWITFVGLAEPAAYLELLGNCHAGLMLNLSSRDMSRTTFPSKVLEYAAAGLLVVSTPVSDVPSFFGAGGAMLLPDETPQALCRILIEIADDTKTAAAVAARGEERTRMQCESAGVAARLAAFLAA